MRKSIFFLEIKGPTHYPDKSTFLKYRRCVMIFRGIRFLPEIAIHYDSLRSLEFLDAFIFRFRQRLLHGNKHTAFLQNSLDLIYRLGIIKPMKSRESCYHIKAVRTKRKLTRWG